MRGFLACCALAWALAVGLPARALVDEGGVNAAKAAADEILRRAEGSAKSGVMPRRSDPAVARLLDQVFDQAALGTGIVPISKVGPIGELARNGNRVGLAYILAGTGRDDASGADQETLQRVDRNTVTFAPEIGQFTDFQLGTTQKMAQSALDFIAGATPQALDQPKVKSGLAQMRSGFAQTVGGVLKTITIRDLTPDWKAQRVSALEGIADTAARFLEAPQKASVKALADEVANTVDPALKPRVQAFGQRLAAPAR